MFKVTAGGQSDDGQPYGEQSNCGGQTASRRCAERLQDYRQRDGRGMTAGRRIAEWKVAGNGGQRLWAVSYGGDGEKDGVSGGNGRDGRRWLRGVQGVGGGMREIGMLCRLSVSAISVCTDLVIGKIDYWKYEWIRFERRWEWLRFERGRPTRQREMRLRRPDGEQSDSERRNSEQSDCSGQSDGDGQTVGRATAAARLRAGVTAGGELRRGGGKDGVSGGNGRGGRRWLRGVLGVGGGMRGICMLCRLPLSVISLCTNVVIGKIDYRK